MSVGFRLVVASDKFKGSLTSNQVAVAVGEGVRRVCPDATVDAVPVADGGDGTLAAAVAAGFKFVPVTASGPTGRPVRTGYARRRAPAAASASARPMAGCCPAGRLQDASGETTRYRSTQNGRGGDVAVVELADVSGLVRLPGGRPAPMTATSRGTGELIAAAIDSGCTRIILGIGGSASTDGGAGLVRALGAKLYDATGKELPEGGAALSELASVDLTTLTKRLAGVEIIVACDVDNPLTGPTGAAATYAPQKGADPTQVDHLDAALSHWADHVARARRDMPGYPRSRWVPTGSNPWEPTRTRGTPASGSGTGQAVADLRQADGAGAGQAGSDLRHADGAGAAGGVGFAALALLDAELRPGIELMLELVGFRRQLVGADLVITGEGALDEQTLHGKAVVGVAAAAGAVGIPVVAVCGSNRLDPDRLRQAGVMAAYALTDLEADVRRCIAEPIPLLRQLGERIAADHLPRSTMTSTERGVV